jgi:hypothetical protein
VLLIFVVCEGLTLLETDEVLVLLTPVLLIVLVLRLFIELVMLVLMETGMVFDVTLGVVVVLVLEERPIDAIRGEFRDVLIDVVLGEK